ncbi:ZIP family metal transporter [Clostridium sp. D2Q-11]|uniref:ZIP family metal transporter n=1 Tax=Anaeromonas frigoriresistens TaxID=2683708 RepID=A0A942UWZ8_9FIRM|nr:ZIP family metal transporter [Anaeromonas frigoriresistens]MBS4538339.1 ZIP family metal transporter [Anaeromonas frigoriresistens]
MELYSTTVIGFMVGIIGTGLGGLLAVFLVKPNNRFLSILLGLTAGLMLSIITFDLLPEAIELAGLGMVVVGIIIGILLVLFIEDIFDRHDRKHKNLREGFLRAGLLMGFGIALHNLPEGLAVGSGFMFTSEMGIKVAIVIALHNLPEGIAMATPLRMSGFGKLKVFILTLLAGVPTGIGAFLGAILGSISNMFIGLCLAIAAGTMLYITCGELIPNSKTIHRGRISTVGLLVGFIIGLLIVEGM